MKISLSQVFVNWAYLSPQFAYHHLSNGSHHFLRQVGFCFSYIADFFHFWFLLCLALCKWLYCAPLKGADNSPTCYKTCLHRLSGPSSSITRKFNFSRNIPMYISATGNKKVKERSLPLCAAPPCTVP